jgi:hypothetical protein
LITYRSITRLFLSNHIRLFPSFKAAVSSVTFGTSNKVGMATSKIRGVNFMIGMTTLFSLRQPILKFIATNIFD